jgi:hypothetical protein
MLESRTIGTDEPHHLNDLTPICPNTITSSRSVFGGQVRIEYLIPRPPFNKVLLN